MYKLWTDEDQRLCWVPETCIIEAESQKGDGTMTVQELYQNIEGDYAAALKVMMMEPLVSRMIMKFPADPGFGKLTAATETMDGNGIFEAAHAMKGTCASLGLVKLSGMAAEVCEEFRPGRDRMMTDGEVRDRVEAIRALYEKTIAGIQAFGGK